MTTQIDNVEITHDNNFCRVFEMPETFPSGSLFGGGKHVGMKMVDWFYPINSDEISQGDVRSWEDYTKELIPFLQKKSYVKPGRQYVLVTRFNKSLVFTGAG